MISGDSKLSRARRLVRAEARFAHFGNLQTKFTMPLETSFCDFAKKIRIQSGFTKLLEML
jgi:hypothetical protein